MFLLTELDGRVDEDDRNDEDDKVMGVEEADEL